MAAKRRPAQPDTLKVEANVARAPMFAPEPRLGQLALEWPEVPYERAPFRITTLANDGPLTIPDLAVFAHLCTRYLWERPADRRVPISLAEVARWLGHEHAGGKQRRQAKASLDRLCGIRIVSALRRGSNVEALDNWGLLARATFFTRGRGRGYVTLHEVMAAQLQAGWVVLLDGHVASELLRRDQLAYRLWVYLESQTLQQLQRRAIFASRPGEPSPASGAGAIADVLRLRDHERRRIVRKVRRACAAIMQADPRYRLDVEQAKAGSGMWNLVARRGVPRPAEWVPRGHGSGYPEATEMGTQRPRQAELGLTLSDAPATLGNGYPEATPQPPYVESYVESYVTSRAGARARGNGSNQESDRDEAIARAHDRLADPTTSADVKAVARCQVQRLGALEEVPDVG